MKKLYTLLGPLLFSTLLMAQSDPVITSWIINTNGGTGYNGIPSNVQLVQYSVANVYVSASCIPGYSIGPWAGNPNTPANQNFVYKFTRNPQQNTGTATAAGLGHIGVWSNGVSIFNPKDAFSYNNQNVWYQDALVFEGSSFDNCLGHPAPNGEYHHHVNPTCLYNDADSMNHSPVIGYAFDGFPVYGTYGFANGSAGTISRMRSSYRLRNISVRNSLPDGTVLSAAQYGPAIGGQYPLGAFIEDYEYVSGLGDLDAHNGRLCVTPEYPAGTYAYFVTIDSSLYPVYPYVIGPTYYGTVTPGNTGPNGGHVTISEPVTVYIPGTSGLDESGALNVLAGPVPLGAQLNVYIPAVNSSNFTLRILDEAGRLVKEIPFLQSSIQYSFEVSELAAGLYVLQIFNKDFQWNKKLLRP